MNNHSVVYLQHMCFSSNNHRDQVHRGEDEIFHGKKMEHGLTEMKGKLE